MLIGLYGNYGAGNAGDELVGLGLARTIQEAAARRGERPTLLVFAHKPELARPWWGGEALLYRTLPAGVRSFFTGWLPSVLALVSCDVVFVGGGTLLTSASSQRFPSAMQLWRWQFALLRALCRRVVFVGQGFGPFATSIEAEQARAAVAGCDVLVRDKTSQELIPGSSLGGDPVFLLEPGKTYARVPDDVFHVAVSVRGWGLHTDAMIARTAAVLREVAAAVAPRQVQLHGVPMQHPLESDYVPLSKLAALVGSEMPCSVMEEGKWNAESVRETIARADLVVGMRLHTNLLAVLHRKPFIALDYQGKTAAVLGTLHLAHRCVDIREEPDTATLANIRNIVQKDNTDVWQGFYCSRIKSIAYNGFMNTIIEQVAKTKTA